MISEAQTWMEAVRERGLLDAVDRLLAERLRERARLQDASSEAALTATVVALCRACAEGSLCLPLDGTLDTRLRDLSEALGLPPDETAAERFRADLRAGRLDAVLGTPDAPKPLIVFRDNLYLHRFAFAERGIAQGLAARLGAAPGVAGDALQAVLRETLDENPLRAPDGSPLALTSLQREALAVALRERVFVLSGGPGTGKTTWTAAWLRAVLRLPGTSPERIRLCAPTGRAARRLEESLRERLAASGDAPADVAAREVAVTTLHALLGYRAFEGRFARGPGDPLDADWILLDEASMADVFLLASLVKALPPHARLVLAGDPDQLPAVEAGAVLAELLPARAGEPGPVPSVTLDVGHRARGDVAALAGAVRLGDAPAAEELLGAPLAPEDAFASARALARIEPPAQDAPLPDLMRAYAREGFGADYAAMLERFRTLRLDEEPRALDALWKHATRTRVLAPLRRGGVSAERANRILRDLLQPSWRRPGDTGGAGFHGAPILVTRNDERTGLSNGDVGLWLESAEGATVLFPQPEAPGGWLRLQAALLPAHELGFASTVHKSQGSEYDEVLVLLPEAGNRLLSREVLYTALTRARAKVRILASAAALRESVERRLLRHGGLRGWFEAEAAGRRNQG